MDQSNRDVVGKYGKFSNTFSPLHLPSDFERALESIDPADFQGLLPLPYYHKGSENFAVEGTDKIYQTSMTLAYHTRLPLWGSFATHTSIPESKESIQILSPDFSLIKFKKEGYATAHPEPPDILMIIEVSDTTYKFDRHVKLPIYATSGIPVYRIINLNKNCIEVYEEPVDERYHKRKHFNPGDQIPIQGRSFDVAEILLTN